MKHNFLNLKKVGKSLRAILVCSLFVTSCAPDDENLLSETRLTSTLSNESVELAVAAIISDTKPQNKKRDVENAIDGNLGSRWAAKGKGVNLDLDLGGVYNVDYINISWYKGNKYRYKFKAYSSNDGENFTLLNTDTSTGTTEDLEMYDLVNGDYQYLRLKLFGPKNTGKGNKWNSIYEIEVYGTAVEPEVPEVPSTQNAFITDTSDADTGELRVDLGESIAVGMMSVTISKQATQDGFINLSGTSTSRKNAMIDMRIDDGNGYEFTESGATVNELANFPAFVNDELVDVLISWDATNAEGPLVSVTIDGQAVTDAAFLSESQDLAAIQAGVKNVQFRLGGNSSLDATGAGMLVDNLKVYDTSSGAPVIVFEDDFESYPLGYSLDPDATTVVPVDNSPYKNNSFQVTIQPEGSMVEPVTPMAPESMQNGFITDTSDADTGELRLDLGESIAVGEITVTISKQATQDGFINLSGTSTTRRNAMIDMRINDGNGYEFTESGTTVNTVANFPAFVNDQLVDVIISWDATNAEGPLVSVTIDGQAATATAFLSESQDLAAIQAGVRNVQFRLGGNSSLDATGAGMLVDDLKVYDTSSGTPVIVFEDDFESYPLGYSLDPDATTVVPVDDSPYKNNSFQVTVQPTGSIVDPVTPTLPTDGFGGPDAAVGDITWKNWYLSVPIDRADGSGKATSIYYTAIEANDLTDEERTYFDFNADGSFKMNSIFTGYTTSGFYESFNGKYSRTELREYWKGNQTTSDNWYMDAAVHELETTLSVQKAEGEGKIYVAQIHGKGGTSLSGTELTAGPATIKVQWFEDNIVLEYYTIEGVVDGEWTSASGTVAKATVGEVGNNKFTVRLKTEGGKFYMALYCEATGVDTGYVEYYDYLAKGYEYQNYFKTGNYFRHDEDYTSVSEVTLYSAVTNHTN